MAQLLCLLITLTCFLAVLTVLVLLMNYQQTAKMAKRSRAILHPYLSVLDERTAASAGRMVEGFSGFSRWLRIRLGIGESDKLRQRLVGCGYSSRSALDIYFGVRILLPIAAIGVGTFFTTTIVTLVGIAAAGYMFPDYFLERAMKKRRLKIRRALPDTVDLMVICMEAGLGMDQALQRTADILYVSYPELCEELRSASHAQRLGQSRREAWRQLAGRTGSTDLEQVTDMLVQADAYGTPVSDAMRVFAESLRTNRRQAAEEKAARSSIVMLFPLVFFIFPAIFVVLLGPAVINLIHGLSGFGH